MSDDIARRRSLQEWERQLKQVGNAEDQLLELVPYLPEDLLPRVLQAALSVRDPLRRLLTLIPLIERGHDPLPANALAAAREAAEAIADPEQRVLALLALASVVRDTQEFSILREAVNAALAVTDNRLRDELVDRVARRIARSQSPQVDSQEALELVQEITQLPARSDRESVAAEMGLSSETAPAIDSVCAYLLTQAAPGFSPNQLRSAVVLVRQIPNAAARATALDGMAQVFPLNLLQEGLSAALEIEIPGERARALVGFVPQLQDPSQQTDIAEEALVLSREIPHWSTQATTFRRLNNTIPDQTVPFALETEMLLSRPGVRTRALASLSPRLNAEQLGAVIDAARAAPLGEGKLLLLRATMDRAEQLGTGSPPMSEQEWLMLLGQLPAAQIRLSERALKAAETIVSQPEDEVAELRALSRQPSDLSVASIVQEDPQLASEMAAAILDRSSLSLTNPRASSRANRPRPWPVGPQHVVSTGFSDLHKPTVPISSDRALGPDRSYLFWMEVGPPVAGAIDERPTELPVDLLPQDAELDVVIFSNDPKLVVEGNTSGKLFFDSQGLVQVRRHAHQLNAPPYGDHVISRRLFFQVNTPREEGEYRLRCSIFYRQVLVQSREVTLRVASSETSRPASLVTRLDYTLSRNLSPAHLRRYAPHKLCVMVNEACDGSHNFHFFGKNEYERSPRFDGHEVQDIIDRLRRKLRLASWDSEEPWEPGTHSYRYDEPATFDQLFKDLYEMARAGIRTYGTIANRLGPGPQGARQLRDDMRTPGMVQLALRDTVRLVIPLALLYDYPFDPALRIANCRLCDHFQVSVGGDEPLEEQDCFKGECPSYADTSVVCPGGFWGFRHELGVPLTLPEGNSPPDIDPILEPADKLELAVAVCTDEQFQKRILHEETLRNLRPWARFHYANTRSDTLNTMLKEKAQVFYFYCHGGVDDRIPYIQVGPLTDDWIESVTLLEEKIQWDKPRPLVFVNGCHTVNVEPEVAIEMVTTFIQTAGASAVVGTETTVFEALAVRFGALFIQAFSGGDTLGWSIRKSRLAILKEQLNPLGLTYVPYGLASLHLAKQQT